MSVRLTARLMQHSNTVWGRRGASFMRTGHHASTCLSTSTARYLRGWQAAITALGPGHTGQASLSGRQGTSATARPLTTRLHPPSQLKGMRATCATRSRRARRSPTLAQSSSSGMSCEGQRLRQEGTSSYGADCRAAHTQAHRTAAGRPRLPSAACMRHLTL